MLKHDLRLMGRLKNIQNQRKAILEHWKEPGRNRCRAEEGGGQKEEEEEGQEEEEKEKNNKLWGNHWSTSTG